MCATLGLLIAGVHIFLGRFWVRSVDACAGPGFMALWACSACLLQGSTSIFVGFGSVLQMRVPGQGLWLYGECLACSLQGSTFFWVGFGFVVWGWTIIGFCVETYGFFLLFSGFFPTALSFLRRVPVLGKILDAPGIKNVRFWTLNPNSSALPLPRSRPPRVFASSTAQRPVQKRIHDPAYSIYSATRHPSTLSSTHGLPASLPACCRRRCEEPGFTSEHLTAPWFWGAGHQ